MSNSEQTKREAIRKASRHYGIWPLPFSFVPKDVILGVSIHALNFLAEEQDRARKNGLWKSGEEAADVFLSRNWKPEQREVRKWNDTDKKMVGTGEMEVNPLGPLVHPKMLYFRGPDPKASGLVLAGDDHVSAMEIVLLEANRAGFKNKNPVLRAQRVLFPMVYALLEQLCDPDEDVYEQGPRFNARKLYPSVVRRQAEMLLSCLPSITRRGGFYFENPHYLEPWEREELEREVGTHTKVLDGERGDQFKAEIEAANELEAKEAEEVQREKRRAKRRRRRRKSRERPSEEIPQLVAVPVEPLPVETSEAEPKNKWARLADVLHRGEMGFVRFVRWGYRLLWRLLGWNT